MLFFRQVRMVNLPSLFPYGWEFGNLKLQQLSRYFRNAEVWIPACAGMTATAVSDDFYGRMMKFIRKYEKRSSENLFGFQTTFLCSCTAAKPSAFGCFLFQIDQSRSRQEIV